MRSSRKAIIITVLLTVVLLMVMTAPALATRGEKPAPDEAMLSNGADWVDGTYSMLPGKEKATRALAAKFGVESLIPDIPAVQAAVPVGFEFTVEVSDDYAQVVYDQAFVVESVGEHGIICIAKEAYDGFSGGYYHFANPNGTWSHTEDLISPAQLDYMLTTFDTTIWTKMAATFGTPLARGAEGQKVWILIYNIRDEAYYSSAAGSYIAGYFSSAEDAANNKNMMHIDTYDWVNRIGADSARPFLYEGVFAHEYQHLLHFDMDPDEESWVDEGLADLAAFLCGFMEDNGHVLYYLAYHPYTSLTFWGGDLQNYGADYLFQLYLYEQYGGAKFTKALFRDQANGIPGIQNTLNKYGSRVKFDTVFDNWTLANYFDLNIPSKYGYRNIALGPDTGGRTMQYFLDAWYNPDSGFPYDPDLLLPLETTGSWFYWWNYPYGPLPYTAQYYALNRYPSVKVFLDGDNSAGTSAWSGTQQMISGQGTWTWRSFQQTFAVPAGTNTLSFYTFYDIEENWDYGYVEVWDQTADEYYTLELLDGSSNPLTTTLLAFPQDSPNVPDTREPIWYDDNSRWNALTGSSGGWVQAFADLSPFAGHTITIYFRTWQDGAMTLQMMYVDDVAIDWATGADYFTDFESGLGGWSTPAPGDTAGWSRGTGLVANDWQATLAKVPSQVPFQRNVPALSVYNTKMNSVSQSGTVSAKGNSWVAPYWIYVVSNRADHIIVSDYYLEAWDPSALVD